MNYYDINDKPLDHLTQWETGRKIKVKGLNPSKVYEAHLFNSRSKTAQVMSTVNGQGTITIEILDRILQEPYMITVVIHEKTSSTSFAVARIEIPVEEAARPEKYVPTDPDIPPIAEYVLPIASDVTLGGVKGKKKTSENVPVAIDTQGRMFVPPYPAGGGSYTLPIANANTLGGVKAKTKSTNDTVEVSVDGAGKLYVPTYPASVGSASFFEINFADFNKPEYGIGKGQGFSQKAPYEIWKKAQTCDAPIKMSFSSGETLVMSKSSSKKQGSNVWYAINSENNEIVVYTINFRNQTMMDWSRNPIQKKL